MCWVWLGKEKGLRLCHVHHCSQSSSLLSFTLIVTEGLILRYNKSPRYEPSSCTLWKMQRCVPSTSGINDMAACPPSPIADDPSALPSPASSPSLISNSSSCAFWQPLYAGYCPVQLYFWRYYTGRLKMLSLFFVFFFYVLFLCIHIIVYIILICYIFVHIILCVYIIAYNILLYTYYFMYEKYYKPMIAHTT